MTDPLDAAIDKARQEMATASAQADSRYLARTRTHAHVARFAAAAHAAGATPLQVAIRASGVIIGHTHVWLVQPDRLHGDLAVTVDGHLVLVRHHTRIRLGAHQAAGVIHAHWNPDRSLQPDSDAWVGKDADDVVNALGWAMHRDGLIAHDPRIAPTPPTYLTYQRVAVTTSATIRRWLIATTLLIAWIAVLSAVHGPHDEPANSGAFNTILAAGIAAGPVMLVYMFFRSRTYRGRPIVRKLPAPSVTCPTCGNPNPVEHEHLCTNCRRVLPANAPLNY